MFSITTEREKHGQQLQFHITALMRVRIPQPSEDSLVQQVRTAKNNQPCFVYGLAVQWSNSRIVAPEVAGSNPVQVAKCVLHLKVRALFAEQGNARANLAGRSIMHL